MHILEVGGAEQEDDSASARSAEAAFRTVPRDHTAFLVWRISESSTELLPRTHYGTFYDGEAYLVYSASLVGQPAGPDVIRREIKESNNGGDYGERHIHAWSGDRAGVLAALALRRAGQLASLLPAPAVLHREPAAKETPRFYSYFRDGIRIVRSGAATGSARLFRVRGRRPLMQQLDAVSWSQLAADGVFVLDASSLVVLWLGRAANLVEKIFGAKIAYRMARGADKGITARRIAIAHDGYEQTLPAADRTLLDDLLELRSRAVRPAAPVAAPPRPARLYRASQSPRTGVVPARPAARLEEIKRAPLYKEDLADDGVFIIDAGCRGVWAWIGSNSNPTSARGALAAARGLARARRHPGAVCAAPAGREPLEFAALFHDWRWADARRDVHLRVARSATTRLDAVSLAANAWLAAETQLPDDGSGALRVWRVRPGAPPAEAAHAQAAVFYDRDVFLALYTYHAPTGDQSVLYCWMGGSSPNDLRNLGAKEAKDLYVKLGRLPVQVRVYQGKEPAHFLQIFKGRMITYVGSATDYDPSGCGIVAPSRYLVQVSGQYAREARGCEVRAGREGSGRGACFVLREGARVWVWCAGAAQGDEREVAKTMAAADHALVMQGNEKEDFWAALGDRRHLLRPAPQREVPRPLPPRLFYVGFGVPGQYQFEEIASFSQYSLLPEMAAILDAHCAVYVWRGAHCGSRAQNDAILIADAYIAADPAARDPETPVIIINQGREPPNFTGFFPHWKANMWKGHKTFSAIVSALEGKSIVQSGNTVEKSGNSANRFDQHEKYPLSVLKGPREHLPPDVDPLAKELYLTHDDFVATFSLSYNDFRGLPGWKQKDLKKLVGLF